MNIVAVIALSFLVKLAVTLLVGWLAKDVLSKLNRTQKGMIFFGVWGVGYAGLKVTGFLF
jgi:hypothetical protein